MKDKAAEFLDYVKQNRKKTTYNVYSFGLRRFLDWIDKTGDEIVKDAKQRRKTKAANTSNHS